MGTPATADLLSEDYGQDGAMQRSFATPPEAAFLRDYVGTSAAAGEMPRNPDEADAIAWVGHENKRRERVLINALIGSFPVRDG